MKKDKGRLKNVVYYVASLLMPSILLFNLYNQNHARNHIVFIHVLVLAGVLALVGLLLLIALRFTIKSIEGGLFISLLFWLSFWLFGALLDLTRVITAQTGPRRLLVLMLILAVIVVVVARRFGSFFEKIRPAFNVLSFVLIVLFFVNLIPGINHEISLARARAEIAQLEDEERPFYIKRSFNVDMNLPAPDIYWIHMDGLVSIEKVERFWGLNYDHYREKLQDRGFMIYEDAEVNGGFTLATMPALLSPGFYDSFWREQLANTEEMLNIDSEKVFYLFGAGGVLERYGLRTQDDIILGYELFNALFARGYEMNIIGTEDEDGFFPMSFEHLLGVEHSFIRRSQWNQFLRSSLPELLSLTTPLSIFYFAGTEDDAYIIRHLIGIEPVGNFVFTINNDAHMGYVQNRVEEPSEVHNAKRYDLYPTLGFEYAFLRMIDKVDEILERNPNAVIVLQSDHGLHIDLVQEHLLEQGYTLEQVLELTFSTFSAVRIPDEYGGLEVPLAPVNISRELVNRFVGENYELLLGE